MELSAPADFVHDSLEHKGSFPNSLRSLTEVKGPCRVSMDYGEEANPTMPTRAELQVSDDSKDTPRRISLQFYQSTTSIGSSGSTTSLRKGRLGVSLGTSNLPRRGAPADPGRPAALSQTKRVVSTGSNSLGAFKSRTTSFSPRPGRVNNPDSFIQRSARRITMDNGASPREQQALRRTTMDHTDTRPVVRRVAPNKSSRPTRRTTLDHQPVPPPTRRTMPRNPSIRPARRTTMDHCRDRSPEADAPPPRKSLTRSTMVMAGAPDSKTGRRLTMDLKSPTDTVKCGGTPRRVTMDTAKTTPRRPARRMLPRRTYSGRAA